MTKNTDLLRISVNCDVEISVFAAGRIATKACEVYGLFGLNYSIVGLCELWCEQRESYIEEIYHGVIPNSQVLVFAAERFGKSRILVLPNVIILNERIIGSSFHVSRVNSLCQQTYERGDSYYLITIGDKLSATYIFNWKEGTCSLLVRNKDFEQFKQSYVAAYTDVFGSV